MVATSLQTRNSEHLPTPLQTTVWLLIVVLALAISLSRYEAFQPGTSLDDADYVILARSLVDSPAYGKIHAPGDPGNAKYPFIYPLLLVPIIVLFPNDLVMAQIPASIATILNAVLLFWGWRWLYPHRSSWWALAVCALYAVAPITISHSRRIMSEPIFTFFCLSAIILAERFAAGNRSQWTTLLLSITMVFVVFTRTIGLVLIGVIFLYLLAKIGWKFWKNMAVIVIQMAIIVTVIVVITPVQLSDLLPLEYFKDENARFLVNLFKGNEGELQAPTTNEAVDSQPISTDNPPAKSASLETLLTYGIRQHLGKDLRNIALPIGGGQSEEDLLIALGLAWLPAILGYLVSIVVIFGLIRLLIQRIDNVFLLFAVVYFMACFFWVWNDIRLLYPIQPQIQLALLAGIEGILLSVALRSQSERLKTIVHKYVLPTLVVILVLAVGYKSTQMNDSRVHAGDLQLRTEWLVAHSETSDVIMTMWPEVDYIHSQRKAVNYPAVSSAEQLQNYIESQGVRYILVAPRIEWQDNFQPEYHDDMQKFLPLLEELRLAERINLSYVSENDKIMVYRVQSESEAGV